MNDKHLGMLRMAYDSLECLRFWNVITVEEHSIIRRTLKDAEKRAEMKDEGVDE